MESELGVYEVVDGLQAVPLPWVLGLEQAEEAAEKWMVYVIPESLRFGFHDQPQENVIDLSGGAARVARQ